MCVRVYTPNMHVYVCVCMFAHGQKLCLGTNQDSAVKPAGGVLAPWFLGGDAIPDTLMMGTRRAH